MKIEFFPPDSVTEPRHWARHDQAFAMILGTGSIEWGSKRSLLEKVDYAPGNLAICERHIGEWSDSWTYRICTLVFPMRHSWPAPTELTANLEDEHLAPEADNTSSTESVSPRKPRSFFQERPPQVTEVAPQLLRRSLSSRLT